MIPVITPVVEISQSPVLIAKVPMPPPIAIISEPVIPVPILIVSVPVPVPILIARVKAPPAPNAKVVAAVFPTLTVVAVVLPRFKMPAAIVSSPCPAATVILPALSTLKFCEVKVRALPVPVLQAEAAAPVRFKAPAEVRAKVPEVAVWIVRLLEVFVQDETPPEARVKAFAPVDIEEADKPDKAKAPEAAVKFKAPVVRVKPFEAVKVEAKAPVPVKLAAEEIVCPLIKPEVIVPVVVRFSLSKDMSPPEAVTVRSPDEPTRKSL